MSRKNPGEHKVDVPLHELEFPYGWWVSEPSDRVRGVKKPSYHIGRLPGREGVVLYRQETTDGPSTTTVTVLATFVNMAAAREIYGFLDILADATWGRHPHVENVISLAGE